MGIPERARNWYQRQTPAFRRCLDAFAQGINDYVRENTAEIDPDRLIVLPVQATDILAHLQRMIHFTFVSRQQAVAAAAERRDSGGSNAWAIAPSRSASGHAMLLANPHLPWAGRFRFFEAHLQTKGVNIYGANLVGAPVLGTAFNERLGWTHTVNTLDGHDLYELQVEAGGYRWNGRTLPFDEHREILKIKQPDGGWKEESLIVKRSIHGPVVDESEGRALAVRVVGLDQPGALEQWWNMGRARNIEEFEDAVRELQIPTFTIVYADRDGRIMHLFNGRVPGQAEGRLGLEPNRARGHRSDPLDRYAPLPGSASRCGPPERLAAERKRSSLDDDFSPRARPREVPRLHGSARDELSRAALGSHAGRR